MPKRTCVIEGCTNGQYLVKLGLCRRHFLGPEGPPRTLSIAPPKPYRKRHEKPARDRPLRQPKPMGRPRRQRPTCISPVCDRVAVGGGLCAAHYQRRMDTGDARLDEPVRPFRRPPAVACLVPWCRNGTRDGDYCKNHREAASRAYPNETEDFARWAVEHLPRDHCWHWPFGKNQDGYGSCVHGRAHIFVFMLDGGTIPDGMESRHRCDNRACVNPDHIEPGTHRENMRDKKRRPIPFGSRTVTPVT